AQPVRIPAPASRRRLRRRTEISMPIGYLVTTVVAGAITLLALRPRPTRGPRATPAFVIESSANELPFLIFCALVASTLLAIDEHDFPSPGGGIGLAVALLTTVGLAIVVRRAIDARAALPAALANGLRAEPPQRTPLPLGRVLIAPLRVRPRGMRRRRDVP